MKIAIDLETECAVESCRHFGSSRCPEGHSLSPWHGRITKFAYWSPEGHDVASGEEQAIGLAMRVSDQEWIAHNGKFDILWLCVKDPANAASYQAAWQHDTQLAAFVSTDKIAPEWLEEYEARRPKHVRKGGLHSLKTLAPYFLGVPAYWEPEHGHDDDAYVLLDVEYTYRLHVYLQENISADSVHFYVYKLLPWSKMLLEAELRGLKLDVDGLLKYRDELEEKERGLKAQLDKLWAPAHAAYTKLLVKEVNAKYDAMKDTKAREPRRQVALSRVADGVSYDSPAQMKWLMASYLGYDLTSLEGDESTGKEVLNRLADEGHEDIKVYTEWRKTQKLLTAFIPSLLALRDSSDIIHPIYNPTGARTGRTSSERPNAQQIPSNLKRFFAPPAGKLVGYDQSAIEAKLIAAYTEDPVLMDVIKSGESIHNVNTITFFDLDCKPSEVPALYPKHRKASKNVGFALYYHAGANRIRIAFTQAGFPITMATAKSLHRNFLNKHAPAMEFARGIVEELENGDTITNLLGRPIKIQDARDAYMQGMNTLVQSSASDINLDRMHSAITKLREAGIECYPLLTVHDYAGIEVVGSDDVVRQADTIVSQELTDFSLQTSLGEVRLEVEGGVSNEWT